MRVAAVLLASALYALALPPWNFSLLAWVALTPLVLVVRDVSPASALWYGCLFGYAYGWGVLWSLVDTATRFFHLAPSLAVLGAAGWFLVIVGTASGVFAATARAIDRRYGPPTRPWLVAAAWVASEMLRGRLVGQPWGLLGYTQHAALPLIQVVAATGVYGVSFLLALTAAACAEALRARALRPVLVPALVVALCWTGGRIVLRNAGADAPDDGRARQVALVQTNTSPVDRWTRSYIGAAVTAHVRATDSIPADAHPALVVWPEYAVPTYVERDPSLTALLAATARRHATDILFGAPRRSEAFSFNSVRLVTASGRDGGHYDKRRLVWFAETNPLAPASASAASDDSQPFASGREPGVLQSFARLGVTICHEVIHPDLVAEGVRHGAEVLVNVANDGWIGAGSLGGAEQHLAMATLRAVETRRFLVRAALTGISAVVDPFGRIVDSLPYGQRGVLVAAVRPLDETTWYVRFGDVFAYACCFVAVGALGLAERRRLLRPLGAD